MNNLNDLHILQEVLPLFDFTHNDFSKEALVSIFKEPLSSTEEILYRQEVLKGFIENLDFLNAYSYSRVDLFEVYTFLGNYSAIETPTRGLKLRLLLSERERHQTMGRYIQVVLLFHKLQLYYLKRIDTKHFPEDYKREILSINDFLICRGNLLS